MRAGPVRGERHHRFPGCLAVLATLALACGEPTHSDPPDVLLVTIDTLRADRVGARRAAGPSLTPFIDGLAKRGLRFTRTYAPSPWTVPSMASLVTGSFPARHGVEHSATRRDEVIAQEVLPEDVPLLAEVLSRRGYATFGVTANGHLGAEHGYGRGFDRYACLGFEHDGQAVLEQVEAWLPAIRAQRPRFVWVHLLDPHAPYRAAEPYFSRHGARERLRHLEEVEHADEYRALGVESGSEALAYVEHLYDSEVASVDRLVGTLLGWLDAPAHTLVILVADHGEEFREHTQFGHSKTLFEEVLRVPLVVRLPGERRAGEVIDVPVSLVDVVPTVLEAAGISVPENVQGMSLLLPAPSLAAERPLFLALDRRAGGQGVVMGPWKYLALERPQKREWLFHLPSDPGETRNRAAAEAERVRALAEIVATHRRTSRAARRAEPRIHSVDPEQAEALRRLGYAE